MVQLLKVAFLVDIAAAQVRSTFSPQGITGVSRRASIRPSCPSSAYRLHLNSNNRKRSKCKRPNADEFELKQALPDYSRSLARLHNGTVIWLESGTAYLFSVKQTSRDVGATALISSLPCIVRSYLWDQRNRHMALSVDCLSAPINRPGTSRYRPLIFTT
jgi:hypothetical protein